MGTTAHTMRAALAFTGRPNRGPTPMARSTTSFYPGTPTRYPYIPKVRFPSLPINTMTPNIQKPLTRVAQFGSKIRGPAGAAFSLAGASIGAGLFSAGIAAFAIKGVSTFGEGIMRGVAPNTYYPATSGRFGVRTAAQAGPAGIEGLKFQFRRR